MTGGVWMAGAAGAGTALTQKKRIDHLALILHNTYTDALRVGDDADDPRGLQQLSLMYRGQAVSGDTVYEEFDEESLVLRGRFDTDTRLIINALSHVPATVLGAVITIKTSDKI